MYSSSTPTNLIIASSTCPSGGRCAQFDGVDDYVYVGNPESLQIAGDQTILMWLKPSELSVRRNPIAKAYGEEFAITHETNGRITYYYSPNNGDQYPYQLLQTSFPDGVVSVGDLKFITFVRDFFGGKLAWYLDGVIDISGIPNYPSAGTSTDKFYIGYGYTLNCYSGIIDEVMVYRRVLSDKEVETIYRKSSRP